jgi:heme A synthase
VKILLRIAAAYSLAWAIGLAFPTCLPFASVVPTPEMRALANGLAIANLAFAYVFNRAAADPSAHRGILYSALILFGLRGTVGTYEVLYLLEGPPAVPQLIDMVLSVALFVALLNALPGTLQSGRPSS